MFVDYILKKPLVFELQQKLCNNYQAVRDHFAEYVNVRNKDILDIGCSTGNCASALVCMRENRYVGIDISPQYVQLAQKRHPLGTFKQMDARNLLFKNNSFDIVMCISCLHHMDDRLVSSCFKELHRVLRDDGVIICADPVFTSGMLLSTVLLSFDRGRHIRNEEGYCSLFKGFTVMKQDHFRFSAHRFCSFISKKAFARRAAA